MNKEESIKGLKEDIYNLKNFLTDTEKEKWQEAIDTALNYIEELEEKIKVCTDTGAKLIDTKFIKNDYIPKQKIRKKIEELEREFDFYAGREHSEWEDGEFDGEVCCDISLKIEALKELLEEE